ncbi:class I SAM-dependent methyltransferase [Rathayibacter soli]|uniref:class I SAM-dependent methyltransferase n=1 Tax=Rathayibacter soli TaxID=3144168 RepID=UPI0027E4A717|nr:class I SAM-dependent methyltransferase [Glaciibacter superstes]
MERSELLELMSPAGLRLLDSLPEYTSSTDALASVSALRKAGHPPALVAAVLSQAKLRGKARSKFGEFASRMLFTAAGLEQATRLRVAALHAGRFQSAGAGHIADLGCGIGGDALAMAALGLTVTAVEADEITAAIAAYNLAPFETANVVNARAEDAAGSAAALADVDGVYIDPARRTAGHSNTKRLTDPNEYSPSLDFAFGLGERMPAGVKLGPGLDRNLIPHDAEAQWISVDGQLVELGVWFGAVAREGIRRSALVLSDGEPAELAGPADSEDEPVGDLGEYLYEPDGSVIRARLIGDLARRMNARMISDGIAYLTTDQPVGTPFAAGFRVRERVPFQERELKRALRERGIGTLEIKKRGADVDPAALRTRLSLRGDASATLVLTRIGGKHEALLVDRL